MKEKPLRKLLIFLLIMLTLLITGFGSFYSYWNSASPEKTCASCHEISSSVAMFSLSAHRKLSCSECHGTAISNGLHSIKEKGMMVVHHIKNNSPEDIRMNESQMLKVMDNCTRCHAAEYANWSIGGHSARYRHILLDTKHNHTEQINPDCLRCHGMFSDLPVNDLVEPLNTAGPWKLKNAEMNNKPVIPCMACHQIHKKGSSPFIPDYSTPRYISYLRQDSSARVGFYNRGDRSFVTAENLPELKLWEGGRLVKVSDDLIMRNCIQCHAPNAHHQAGTSDDRTPRGVHEGLTCQACHDAHSNDAGQSCVKCHPAISNCKLDVTKMNTSYADPKSANNIHWVSCTSCHEEGSPALAKKKLPK
jgi:hypothetical protein